MMRHLRLGTGTTQVLEAALHDGPGASQVVELLERFGADTVHLDATGWVWDALAAGTRRVDRIEDAVCMALGEAARPYALYREIQQWARARGGQVRLLAGHVDPPRRRDVRLAARILAREGLEARHARAAVDELRNHVLPRVPRLLAWHAERAGAVTAQVVRTCTDRDAIVVCTYPDGPAVADLAVRTVRQKESAPEINASRV